MLCTHVISLKIHILKKVSTLDPVKKNVVQFFDHFNHRGHTCLAFELLDKSLIQLLRESMMEPLSLSEIRPITQQVKREERLPSIYKVTTTMRNAK